MKQLTQSNSVCSIYGMAAALYISQATYVHRYHQTEPYFMCPRARSVGGDASVDASGSFSSHPRRVGRTIARCLTPSHRQTPIHHAQRRVKGQNHKVEISMHTHVGSACPRSQHRYRNRDESLPATQQTSSQYHKPRSYYCCRGNLVPRNLMVPCAYVGSVYT